MHCDDGDQWVLIGIYTVNRIWLFALSRHA